MLYGSIRRNLYAHLSIHKMRWTLVFDYLFTPISTPKWHESIWFCMKFYEFTISKNFVTMRFYGLLLMYIDLWKKANLQRYLISSLYIHPFDIFIYSIFQILFKQAFPFFRPFLSHITIHSLKSQLWGICCYCQSLDMIIRSCPLSYRISAVSSEISLLTVRPLSSTVRWYPFSGYLNPLRVRPVTSPPTVKNETYFPNCSSLCSIVPLSASVI